MPARVTTRCQGTNTASGRPVTVGSTSAISEPSGPNAATGPGAGSPTGSRPPCASERASSSVSTHGREARPRPPRSSGISASTCPSPSRLRAWPRRRPRPWCGAARSGDRRRRAPRRGRGRGPGCRCRLSRSRRPRHPAGRRSAGRSPSTLERRYASRSEAASSDVLARPDPRVGASPVHLDRARPRRDLLDLAGQLRHAAAGRLGRRPRRPDAPPVTSAPRRRCRWPGPAGSWPGTLVRQGEVAEQPGGLARRRPTAHRWPPDRACPRGRPVGYRRVGGSARPRRATSTRPACRRRRSPPAVSRQLVRPRPAGSVAVGVRRRRRTAPPAAAR